MKKKGEYEITPFPAPKPASFSLQCTRAGRVRSASPDLEKLLKESLTGRNLNYFLEDDKVACIIAAGMGGERYDFSCTLFQHPFSCSSEFSKDGLILTLMPGTEPEKRYMPPETSIRIVSVMSSIISESQRLVCDLIERADEASLGQLLQLRHALFRGEHSINDIQIKSDLEEGLIEPLLQSEDACAFFQQFAADVGDFCAVEQVTLKTECLVEQGYFVTDTRILKTALIKLVANAFSALREERNPRLQLSMEQNEDRLHFIIADNGSGISENAQFNYHQNQPSPSSDRNGLGLGLLIARQLISLLSGNLNMVSQPGAGTVIRVQIPIENPQKASEKHERMRQMREEFYRDYPMELMECSVALDSHAHFFFEEDARRRKCWQKAFGSGRTSERKDVSFPARMEEAKRAITAADESVYRSAALAAKLFRQTGIYYPDAEEPSGAPDDPPKPKKKRSAPKES